MSPLREENIRLSTPVEYLLSHIATWKLAEQGVTPNLLPMTHSQRYGEGSTVWENKRQ